MAIGNRGLVRSAAISFAASGDNVVVAAVAGKLITIVGLSLVVAAATNITFKDGSNLLSGAYPMTANGSIVFDEKTDFDWFQTTNVANNFIINNSNAVQVSGTVYYIQV